jgi:inhibitor of KinA
VNGGESRVVERDFRIVPSGDSTVVVEFEARIDLAVNLRSIRLAEAVRVSDLAGIRDVVPTFCSVAVFFDPLRTSYQPLVEWLETHASIPADPLADPPAPIEVPVCYGGDLGPDLSSVAARSSMSPEEVAAVHASATYRVFMLGFSPGFAYLGILDERIRVPRHATPRIRVPRGAVGIADAQTGIYPMDTPGGWQIIGRTPVRPFDLSRREPFLFKPGDAVRFVPIDRRAYDVEGAR